jgi:hypothetical protein
VLIKPFLCQAVYSAFEVVLTLRHAVRVGDIAVFYSAIIADTLDKQAHACSRQRQKLLVEG